MPRIRTPHRPSAAAGRPGRRPSPRGGEAAILAAGTLLAALLVAGPAASAGPETGLQLAAADPAAAPDQPRAGVPADGLDLSLPAAGIAADPAAPAPRAPRTRDHAVALGADARLHGLHRLEIDLYNDDMKPRGGAAPR
jgi:hypothetical protein